MSRQLQPLVPLVSLVKTEPLTVIKNEPPEETLEKEISPDIKDIQIVYHSLSEDLIKSETVPENIPETKYSESVETQVLVKTEDSSDENVTRGTGQEVIEVEVSNKYSNVLSTLETDTQLVLNFSKDLNGISTRTRKAKQPEKTNFGKCYKTVETTSWKKDKEKIKVIKAPVIPVEAHEYTSLAKDKHVCNHCQYAFKRLDSLKLHIKRRHREVTTMYQCPYCPYKSKWKQYLINRHIILMHKDTKDIQGFQCHLCWKKFKIKSYLAEHMKVHLKHKKMQDGLDLKSFRYSCEKCAFVHRNYTKFKLHELSHKTKAEMDDQDLKYRCNKCDYKTYRPENLKRHQLNHSKPEEIQYFHCHHCSYKSNQKEILKRHIFRYLKNGEFKHNETIYKNQLKTDARKREKRYLCDQCDFKTISNQNLNRHKLSHLKPEEIQYFYCDHCSFKCQRKDYLKPHIFRHYKKEEIKFHCYVCNFMTSKRELIIEHIKKHSKVQIKSEINEGN